MEFKIKELRQSRGWNQTTLAYHAGMSTSQVSLIESGRRNPSAATLEAIAEALGVGIADLFPKKSYGGKVFDESLARARAMDDDELWVRGRELNLRVKELSKDKATRPKRLGGQGSARAIRELTEAANELRAIAQVVNERAGERERELARV